MIAISLIFSLAASAQLPLERIAFLPSNQLEQQFGASFAELGDVNGDGITDFAVGSPGHLPTSGGWGSGLVEVYSGADMSLIYQVDPIASVDSLLGKELLAIGDVNSDGARDFVVGCGGYTGAYVISGRNGIRLLALDTQSNGQHGMQLELIGDLNGDALPEFAIGLPTEAVGSDFLAGRIMIFDGANGVVLHELLGAEAFRSLGNLLCGPGDLNGDTIPDLIVGGVDGISNPGNGGFTAISGSDFQILYSRDRDQLKHSVVDLDAVGDVNADGLGDFLVTGYQSHPNGMWIQGISSFLSGSDAHQMFLKVGEAFEDFGRSATPLGDMDGDGVKDVAILSLLLNRNWQIRPHVDIISGKTGDAIAIAETSSFNFLTVRLFPISDLDGDGRDELVVGVPENQVSTPPPGYLVGGEVHILSHKN
ncbi:MAG: FG-GAP repeat protein [Planctomycetes bacterium]|nr:FG-GAP repeat protein [Planctomycetota bacterium]